MEEAFVYKWTNIETGKFYIGYHKGQDDDGYISSGKRFMASYKANPNKFVREILHRGDAKAMLLLETRLISFSAEQYGWGKMYNAYNSMYMKMVDLPIDEQDLFYITKQINKLLSDNTKENGFKHHVEIRRLRKLKAKLLKSA